MQPLGSKYFVVVRGRGGGGRWQAGYLKTSERKISLTGCTPEAAKMILTRVALAPEAACLSAVSTAYQYNSEFLMA